MRVLSITHEEPTFGGGGTFEQRVRALGHDLTVWMTPNDGLPGSPPTDFDAVMIFGGTMHPDQDAEHAWIPEEVRFIEEALEQRIPLLGVCLGSQLIARATGAWVGPAEVGEVGWHEVGLTRSGVADPVVGEAFPKRFQALEWHYYTWELPDDAELLAANSAARQAFRLGDRTWGVQFHPEVSGVQLARWFVEGAAELPIPQDVIRAETEALLPTWIEQGQALVDAFLAEAARLA